MDKYNVRLVMPFNKVVEAHSIYEARLMYLNELEVNINDVYAEECVSEHEADERAARL